MYRHGASHKLSDIHCLMCKQSAPALFLSIDICSAAHAFPAVAGVVPPSYPLLLLTTAKRQTHQHALLITGNAHTHVRQSFSFVQVRCHCVAGEPHNQADDRPVCRAGRQEGDCREEATHRRSDRGVCCCSATRRCSSSCCPGESSFPYLPVLPCSLPSSTRLSCMHAAQPSGLFKRQTACASWR